MHSHYDEKTASPHKLYQFKRSMVKPDHSVRAKADETKFEEIFHIESLYTLYTL